MAWGKKDVGSELVFDGNKQEKKLCSSNLLYFIDQISLGFPSIFLCKS